MEFTQPTESDASEDSSIRSAAERNALLLYNSSASSFIDREEPSDEHAGPESSVLAQAAKAIEAAGDRRSTFAASSWRPSIAGSTRSHPWSDRYEQVSRYFESILPNYAEAVASQPPVAREDVVGADSLYEDRSEDGLLDSSSENRSKRSWMSITTRYWKSLCLLNLAIYALFTVTILLVYLGRPSYEVVVEMSLYPTDSPHHPNNFQHPEKFHPNTTECTFTQFSQFETAYIRGPRDFVFVEELELPFNLGSVTQKISGIVEIRPAPLNQYSNIEWITSFAKTSNWATELPDNYDNGIRYPPGLTQTSDAYAMNPFLESRDQQSTACLNIWVGVYVKGPLKDFDIRTKNLDIDSGMYRPFRMQGKFELEAEGDARLYAERGSIRVDTLIGRRTRVQTGRGSITGNFTWKDDLTLVTTEGDITVSLTQAPAYGIDWQHMHPPNTSATFNTTTRSGNQKIYHWQQEDISKLLGSVGEPYLFESYHRSTSGFIAWYSSIDELEATLFAQTQAGSIELGDDAWEPLYNATTGALLANGLNRVHARRGTAASNMSIESVSGDIIVCVGKGPCHSEK